MKKKGKKPNGKRTLHSVGQGRVAVLPHDPTRFVNFEGDDDKDFKFD